MSFVKGTFSDDYGKVLRNPTDHRLHDNNINKSTGSLTSQLIIKQIKSCEDTDLLRNIISVAQERLRSVGPPIQPIVLLVEHDADGKG